MGQSSADISFHHFRLPCNNCHQTQPNTSDNQRHLETKVGKIAGDINQLCTSSGCHNFDPLLNHPVGIKPKTEVPEDMPLDINSRMTCLTCHKEPNSSDGSDYTINSNENFLRRPKGIGLCNECHTNITGTLSQSSHWQFSVYAHLGTINENSQAASRGNPNRFIGELDIESRTCLSCHDSISATIPSWNETPQQKYIRWQSMSDHPIGMEYMDTARLKSENYWYPQTDNHRIRFFSGRMGCGSCHSLYAQNEYHLVERNENGELCLKCHNFR